MPTLLPPNHHLPNTMLQPIPTRTAPSVLALVHPAKGRHCWKELCFLQITDLMLEKSCRQCYRHPMKLLILQGAIWISSPNSLPCAECNEECCVEFQCWPSNGLAKAVWHWIRVFLPASVSSLPLYDAKWDSSFARNLWNSSFLAFSP